MGFDPAMLGVDAETLLEDYILQIAVLENDAIDELEQRFIIPFFKIDLREVIPHLDDYRDIKGLEARPPEVFRYMVRGEPEVLDEFILKNSLGALGQT